MGSTRNNGRLVAGARFSAINNTGERGPADRVVRSAPVGAHDSLYSSSSTVRTHLRLRRGRFFLNEVTKLIFPLLSETIASSSLSLSLSFLHSSLRPCKPLPLYVSALSAIIYPPHYAYYAIIARAERVWMRGEINGRKKFLIHGLKVLFEENVFFIVDKRRKDLLRILVRGEEREDKDRKMYTRCKNI